MSSTKDSSRRWRQKYPGKVLALRARARLRKYGLNEHTYALIWRAQNQRCAICGCAESRGRNWQIDHDHTLNNHAVRGILCMSCNVGLGQFKHSPELLAAASAYLLRDNRVVL